MARMARVVLPGVPHHITQRGVRSMEVFGSDEDRELYLRLLRTQAARFGLNILSWCLMSNHVHLVAVPKKAESLARAVGETHRLYTRAINVREGVRGHLFQERFFSCPLDDRHGVAAVRYVERNPVRAKLAKEAWGYKWSSARFHVEGRERDRLVEKRYPFGQDWDWRELLRTEPEETPGLRLETRTGRPLGKEPFLHKAESRTGRTLRRQRPGPKRKKR